MRRPSWHAHRTSVGCCRAVRALCCNNLVQLLLVVGVARPRSVVPVPRAVSAQCQAACPLLPTINAPPSCRTPGACGVCFTTKCCGVLDSATMSCTICTTDVGCAAASSCASAYQPLQCLRLKSVCPWQCLALCCARTLHPWMH
jgi:hypothetical protein